MAGADYVEALGFAFASDSDAQGLVSLEIKAVQGGQGSYTYPLADVPGAVAFILYSQTRVGGHMVFCHGAWFAYQLHAFELLTCGATPGDGQLAAQLAADQFRKVGGAPVSPSAS